MTYRDIFSYRSVWMFLAALCIVYQHAPVVWPDAFGWTANFSPSCMDILMFASGIGCTFSLRKDPDVFRFLKRRAMRILPIYWASLPLYLACAWYHGGITPVEFIGNVLSLGSFTEAENQFAWYIACMWLCYILTPFFVGLANAYQSLRRRVWIVLIFCVLLLSFAGTTQLMLWTRIPVFFVGVCVAETSTRKPNLTRGGFLLSQIFMIAVMICQVVWKPMFHPVLLKYGVGWFLFLLSVPGQCYLTSWLASLLAKTKLRVLVDLCNRGGKYTLSLCLTHVALYAIYRRYTAIRHIAFDAKLFLLTLVLIVVSSVALEWFAARYTRWHFQRKQRKETA